MKQLLFILSFFLSTAIQAQFGQAGFFGSQTTATTSGYDADAQDYFNRLLMDASFTPTDAGKTRVDDYIKGWKAAGVWTKYTAGSILDWGNAAANAVPLKSGQPTITWSGSITHSTTGITSSGSTGYGNTGIIPSTALLLNNAHMALYSATNINMLTVTSDMGARNSTSQSLTLQLRTNPSEFFSDMWNISAGSGRVTTSNTNSIGSFILTRTASNVLKVFRSGVQFGTTATGTTIGPMPTIAIYLLALNNNGTAANFTDRTISLWHVGQGLTDSEAAAVAALDAALVAAPK